MNPKIPKVLNFSFCFFKVILVVNYHIFTCYHCHQYFKKDISFQFNNRKITVLNVQSALFEFKRNHSVVSISRTHTLKIRIIFCIFKQSIHISHRTYFLLTVSLIDEFKANNNRETYAFHIVNPTKEKTHDTIEDRHSSL